MNEKLLSARLEKHWSQETAAEKIGVERKTYQRWEKGKTHPHPSTLDLICRAFGKSAQELGFESFSSSAMGVASIISHQVIDSDVNMFHTGILALALARQQYRWSWDDLRVRIDEELRRLDRMTKQETDITRRQMLGFLAGLPAAFMSIRLDKMTMTPEEMLPLYVTCIPACWRLYFDGAIQDVERVLPSSIAQLSQLVTKSSPYQRTAASLLSQAHQLASVIVMQREDFGSAMKHTKQAFAYGELARDHNLQVASLFRQGNILFNRQRPTFQVSQEAMSYVDMVSPLLKSRTYSEYAFELAVRGEVQETLRHISLAHEMFPDDVEQDPGYQYTHTNKYVIFLNETLSHLELSQPKKAWEAITSASAFVPEAISSRKIELYKYQVRAAMALGNKELACEHFKILADGARTLGSDMWLSDLTLIHQSLYMRWPERDIHELQDLFS